MVRQERIGYRWDFRTEKALGRRKRELPAGHRGSRTCRRRGKSHESRGNV